MSIHDHVAPVRLAELAIALRWDVDATAGLLAGRHGDFTTAFAIALTAADALDGPRRHERQALARHAVALFAEHGESTDPPGALPGPEPTWEADLKSNAIWLARDAFGRLGTKPEAVAAELRALDAFPEAVIAMAVAVALTDPHDVG